MTKLIAPVLRVKSVQYAQTDVAETIFSFGLYFWRREGLVGSSMPSLMTTYSIASQPSDVSVVMILL